MLDIEYITKRKEELLNWAVKVIQTTEMYHNLIIKDIKLNNNKINVVLICQNYLNIPNNKYAAKEELIFYLNNELEIDKCEILSIDTVNLYRRQGIGTLLIKQAKIMCANLGADYIYGTYMDDESKKFYEFNSFDIDEEKRKFKFNINSNKIKK